MTDFGLGPAGLTIKRLADDILPELGDGMRSIYGSNVDLDPAGPIGQFIGIFGEREDLIWALFEKVYGSAYLNDAEGPSLDRVVALAGIKRLPATRSTVTWALQGTPGTVLAAGSQAKVVNTGAVFELLSTATIGTDLAVRARAVDTGPIRALSTPPTTWAIVTPVAGWTGVTNAADAKEGRNVESDQGLRVRYAQSFRLPPASSAEAMLAALLRVGLDTEDPVTEAVVIENEEAFEDGDGRPAKSFECVVEGGDAQEIVDTIWGAKPLGIKAWGDVSGVAVDSLGAPHTIQWSRPDELPIYVVVRYSVTDPLEDAGDTESFPITGETEIRDAILDYGRSVLAKLGRSVYPIRIEQKIETVGLRTLDVSVGTSPDPSGEAAVIVPRTARALLDSSRVSFERVA